MESPVNHKNHMCVGVGVWLCVCVCQLTRAERMGRNTVSVAGLLANSVTADTNRQASSVTAHGGRPLIGSSCRPIHMDRPDTWPETSHHSLTTQRIEKILMLHKSSDAKEYIYIMYRPNCNAHLASSSQCVSSSHQNNNLPRHQSLEVFPRDHGGQGILFLLIVIISLHRDRESGYQSRSAGGENIHLSSHVLDPSETCALDPAEGTRGSVGSDLCSRWRTQMARAFEPGGGRGGIPAAPTPWHQSCSPSCGTREV